MRFSLEVVNPNIFDLKNEQCTAGGVLPEKTPIALRATDIECKYLIRLPSTLVPTGRVGEALCSAPANPPSVLSEARNSYAAETISVDHSYAQVRASYKPCPVVQNGVVPSSHR